MQVPLRGTVDALMVMQGRSPALTTLEKSYTVFINRLTYSWRVEHHDNSTNIIQRPDRDSLSDTKKVSH